MKKFTCLIVILLIIIGGLGATEGFQELWSIIVDLENNTTPSHQSAHGLVSIEDSFFTIIVIIINGNYEKKLIKINKTTLTIDWTINIDLPYSGTNNFQLIQSPDNQLIIVDNQSIKKISTSDGSVFWSQTIDHTMAHFWQIWNINNQIVAYSNNQKFAIINHENGQIIAEHDLSVPFSQLSGRHILTSLNGVNFYFFDHCFDGDNYNTATRLTKGTLTSTLDFEEDWQIKIADEVLLKIDITTDEKIITLSDYVTPDKVITTLLRKFETNGELIWETNIVNLVPSALIVKRPSNDIFISGNNNGQATIAKYNQSGNLLWQLVHPIAHTDNYYATVCSNIFNNNNTLLLAGKAWVMPNEYPYRTHTWFSEIELLPVSNQDEIVVANNQLTSYPNPFKKQTKISLDLDQSSQVSVSVYNIKGQLVNTLADTFWSAGSQDIIWDGKNSQGQLVGPGIYFIRAKSESFSLSKKVLIIK